MIIVSQERDIIVNFDRIESIWINDNVLDNTRCRFSIVAGEDTIAEYGTEGRAKEVLEEIIEEYEECNRFGAGFVANAVFYMPEK